MCSVGYDLISTIQQVDIKAQLKAPQVENDPLDTTDLNIKTGSNICRSEMMSLATILVCPIQYN